MPSSPQEIYERYLWAGPLTRNADAVADLFTEDGVIEAPLVPPGRAFPRRMAGRDEIRDGLAAFYRRSTGTDRPVDRDRSGYVLHTTAEPDVFIAEIDATFAATDTATGIGTGGQTTMSLVQIFRTRGDKIALLRDYFAPDEVD